MGRFLLQTGSTVDLRRPFRARVSPRRVPHRIPISSLCCSWRRLLQPEVLQNSLSEPGQHGFSGKLLSPAGMWQDVDPQRAQDQESTGHHDCSLQRPLHTADTPKTGRLTIFTGPEKLNSHSLRLSSRSLFVLQMEEWEIPKGVLGMVLYLFLCFTVSREGKLPLTHQCYSCKTQTDAVNTLPC